MSYNMYNYIRSTPTHSASGKLKLRPFVCLMATIWLHRKVTKYTVDHNTGCMMDKVLGQLTSGTGKSAYTQSGDPGSGDFLPSSPGAIAVTLD